MPRILSSLLALAFLAMPALAQTTNMAGINEARVQGFGAGGTSPILAPNQNSGSGLLVEFDAVPNAPFVMVISEQLIPGNLPFQGGFSVDHDFPTADYILDGTGTFTLNGGLQRFLHTGPTGRTSFMLPNVNSAEFCTQFAFVDPSFPIGIATSAAFQVTYGAGVFPAACLGLDPSYTVTPLSLGDDDSAMVSTPTFGFYGTSYSDFFINSNGNITFNSGDTDFSESVSEFLGGEPRIAMWWDDLNPSGSGGGQIYHFTNNIGQAGACYEDVPEFSNTGANNFRVFFTNVNVQIAYGEMSSTDGIVGISPGGNLDPTGTPIDLTAGATLSGGLDAYYEVFDSSNPRDFGFGFTLEFGWAGFGANPSGYALP